MEVLKTLYKIEQLYSTESQYKFLYELLDILNLNLNSGHSTKFKKNKTHGSSFNIEFPYSSPSVI